MPVKIHDHRVVPLWLHANPALRWGESEALRQITQSAAQHVTSEWTVIVHGGPGNLIAPPGVSLHQLAPDCLCCTGQLPLRTTLARVLRLEKPQRLLLEIASPAHLPAIVNLMTQGSLANYLRLEGTT